MKLNMHVTKKNLIRTAVVFALSVFAYASSGISEFNVILFTALYFFAQNLKAEPDERFGWLWTAAAVAAASLLTTWLVQYLLLAEELRGRLFDGAFLLNACISLAVYLAVLFCLNRTGPALVLAHCAIMIFAGANYFVYAFRGNEVTFGDFKSLATGLSVASNYQFSLNAQAMNAILLSVVFCTGAWKLQIRLKRPLLMRILCLSLIMLSGSYVARETGQVVTETWEQKGTYRNGYLLNFALSVRDSFVEKPKTYSKEAVAGLEKKYSGSGKEGGGGEGEKPAIIVIMNESFADFSVLGDLETNLPVTPFFDSLSENVMKGYALASVYGAKTPNSEWEFLTGNSMAFLPSGSVPYQQYVNEKNAYSLVDALKKEDYTCVAMHPYFEQGWSRDAVYSDFGFDETYFLDDFDQGRLMRRYVSDAVMYEKIIERYEAADKDENLFLMGITMQNHGGYRDLYDNFKSDVYAKNAPYPDVSQYLSLARQSDLAIRDLTEYFSGAGRPVVICFFGDHQPSLNTSFYRRLNGKGISGLSVSELQEFYQVPFFIWTNYPSESETEARTSLNYLSALLLKRAGIRLPAYQQFLCGLMEDIPAMNARAYYSKASGRYLHYGKGSAEDEARLEQYRVLQYNGLFDKAEKSELFFGR